MADYDLNYEELLAAFAADSAEDVAALEAGLLALETSPHDDELRRELLRRAHTLKGNASCVGLQAVADFAHEYEEQLERVNDGSLAVDAALVTRLLAGVDTLRRLVEEGSQQTATASRDNRSVRVAAEKLNRMLNLAGEIAIARGRVGQLLSTRAAIDVEELIEVERQVDALQGELQELIMRARMVPVGPLFRQYARTVRDLAAAHGKNARLVTSGDDVELDTTAVEMLRDPLTHMIRNAIDHGLESPEARQARGKAPVGRVSLEARHEAGIIIIRVSDDGAGLDRAAIAARAAALGVEADDRLIFTTGFSTAGAVTDLSGRGVGMDVVQRAIEALRGTISIETREGTGTAFLVRLPLTLAMIDGFGVSVGEETYVVPMDSVEECIELPAGEPRDTSGGVLLIRDQIVPYVRLRHHFALGGAAPERENVLVVQHDGARAGLVVDSLHGAAQAVIKPLGLYFDQIPGVAGSSILGTGRVALILDTHTILAGLAEQQGNTA